MFNLSLKAQGRRSLCPNKTPFQLDSHCCIKRAPVETLGKSVVKSVYTSMQSQWRLARPLPTMSRKDSSAVNWTLPVQGGFCQETNFGADNTLHNMQKSILLGQILLVLEEWRDSKTVPSSNCLTVYQVCQYHQLGNVNQIIEIAVIHFNHCKCMDGECNIRWHWRPCRILVFFDACWMPMTKIVCVERIH